MLLYKEVPGAGPGSERLVAGPVPMGQPEDMTWVPLSTGSLPVGAAKGVGCSVSWVAAEGGDLGGLTLGY